MKLTKNIYLINLKPKISGFDNFLTVWLYNKNDFTVLIDIGPKRTITQLLKKLNKLKIKEINYIFITHIHLDHSGGIYFLINNFKKAKIICSQKVGRVG